MAEQLFDQKNAKEELLKESRKATGLIPRSFQLSPESRKAKVRGKKKT